MTGLGSSLADCFYACVGVFGLSIVSDFLIRWQSIITAAGGVLILAMGIKALIRPQAEAPHDKKIITGARLLYTSFAIGITNPAAILTFMFAFSYFGLSEINGLAGGCLLVTGVFAGTYFWWGALSFFTQLIKIKAVKFRLCTMNRIFGGALCLFGVIVFLRLIF